MNRVYRPTVINDNTTNRRFKFDANAMIKFALAASLIGNITFTTIIVTEHHPQIKNQTEVSVNLSSFPFALRCHLDSTSGYVKNHIFAHICYNEWLDSSIVDLRFEKDGNVTLEDLKNSNLKIFC